jgi:hypothetical protein
VESTLGPLGTSATSGLLYLPWVIVRMDNLVEWRLAWETEVLGENLPQRHFVHQKFHLTRSGREPGPPQWESSNRPLELWRGPTVQDHFLRIDCLSLYYDSALNSGRKASDTSSWFLSTFTSRPGVGNLRLASYMRLFGCEAAAL